MVAAFKQTDVTNIELIDDAEYDFESADAHPDKGNDVVCQATFFAEKLYTQRNLHGILKSVCRVYGWLELLEQYGNYMRVRVSRQDRTIG